MGFLKSYTRYKNFLLATFILNVFFIMAGIAGLIHFLQTETPTALELVIVGAGTLVFGIVLPTWIIGKMMVHVKEMRRHTEETLAKLVGGWLENYRKADDPVRDPVFWINIALVTAETVTENSKHPMARMISEMAPMLRSELHRAEKKSRSKK